MTNEIARMSDVKQSVLYKLRLNKLDETSRLLQKNGIVNNDGFLTVEGCQVFMDALWQSNPEIQESIAKELKKLGKKDKKDKSDED